VPALSTADSDGSSGKVLALYNSGETITNSHRINSAYSSVLTMFDTYR